MPNSTGFEVYLESAEALRERNVFPSDANVADQIEDLVARLIAAEDKIFRLKILPAWVNEENQTSLMDASAITKILYETPKD